VQLWCGVCKRVRSCTMDAMNVDPPPPESAVEAPSTAAEAGAPTVREDSSMSTTHATASNGSDANGDDDGSNKHVRTNSTTSIKDLIMKAKQFESKHANEVPLQRKSSLARGDLPAVASHAAQQAPAREPEVPAIALESKVPAPSQPSAPGQQIAVLPQEEGEIGPPGAIPGGEGAANGSKDSASMSSSPSSRRDGARPGGRRAVPVDPTIGTAAAVTAAAVPAAVAPAAVAPAAAVPAATVTAAANGAQDPGSTESPRADCPDCYISFRAEAANESKALRKALRGLDRSVYLNASKEETIGNWLRELSAVRKASVFVAMVSTTYGEDGGLMEVMPTWEELKQAMRFKKPICVIFLPGVEGISRTLTSSGIDKKAAIMTRWDNGAAAVASEISEIVAQVEEERRRKAAEAGYTMGANDDAQSALVQSDLKRFLNSLSMGSSFRKLRASGITSIAELVGAVEKVSRGQHNISRANGSGLTIEDLSAAAPGEEVSFREAEPLLRATVAKADEFLVVLESISEWALDEQQGAAMASRDGLIEVLCGGLLVHRRDAAVQAAGARAMANLMRPYGVRANDLVARRGDFMARAGGVSVLVKAIDAHANDETVCEHCFKALMDIAVSETNEVLIKNLEGDKAVVAGITKHAFNTAVVVNGIKALANMRVEQAYAINALLAAIKYHGHQEAIQKYGAWALKNVEWYKNPTLVEIAEREHLIDIMENIKLKFQDKEDISKHAAELVENLNACIAARSRPNSARRTLSMSRDQRFF